MRRLTVLMTLLLGLVWGCGRGSSPDAAAAPESAVPGENEIAPAQLFPMKGILPEIPADQAPPELHNLLRVTHDIYSGGEPHGEAAFAALARLGVRTVVSVDGARPDVETAARYCLRYVHVPIGYDGISETAGLALARLARDSAGALYIHCHHGRHRGPAAAAVVCIAAGAADPESALQVLERAGTSRGYAGLWRAVATYRPPAANVRLPELVSVAEVDSLVAAMAQIDRAADNLELCRQSDWQSPADHPDVVPAQEALLLTEGFRESVRHLDGSRDEQFEEWMNASEAAAAGLLESLRMNDRGAATSRFADLQQRCRACHETYRDGTTRGGE